MYILTRIDVQSYNLSDDKSKFVDIHYTLPKC